MLGAAVLLYPEQSGSLLHLPLRKPLSAVFWVLLCRPSIDLLTYEWSSLGLFFHVHLFFILPTVR